MGRITEYSFGTITIDGKIYDADVIILQDRVIPNWWRCSGHKLQPEDLDNVVAASPKKLIIGTGSYGVMRVPVTTLSFLREKGIELVVLNTSEACDLFNKISSENVAAALHLTC